jgi:hypothetical protein
MVQVQEVTFIPNSSGGEVRAQMTAGRQELTTSWPLGSEDEQLKALLDRLTVKVQEITFLSTPNGGEIRAQMTVGERVFVSRVPLAPDDRERPSTLKVLLGEVGRRVLENLQAALKSSG